MRELEKQIMDLLNERDGLTDRELTDRILGLGTPQQSINSKCRQLKHRGVLSTRNTA